MPAKQKEEKMKNIPLSNTFTVVSIIGAIISGFLTYDQILSPTWGFTLTFMFLLFIIASFASIAPSKEEFDELKKWE